MTYAEAAIRVLKEAGEPLHYKELTERALEKGYCTTDSKTPKDSMYTAIAYERGKGGDSHFVKVAPGVFGLREWTEKNEEFAESVDEADADQVRVPHFPVYDEVRRLIPVLAARPPKAFTGMKRAISDLQGTPQDPMDWSDPDTWIDERLSGDHQTMARAIWEKTDEGVNPRHALGHWLLCRRYDLLKERPDGTLAVTERGRDFIENSDGTAVSYLDEHEGIIQLLSIVAAQGPGTKSDFLEDWAEYLRRVSRYKSDNSIEIALYQRLKNLIARDHVERSGYTYTITDAGLDYLGDTEEAEGTEGGEEMQNIRELTSSARKNVREGVRELLEDMDPYDFEHLIQRLLKKMGYDDPEVTKRSNDKGVDVVADIELGITPVREVVQVKRNTTSNIGRPTLDRLRGSLHRFDAVRGTIITTSDFSKGTQKAAFEKGGAPITLINGEKLIDLLIEHRLGVRSEKVEVLRLEPGDFAVSDEEREEAGELE